MNFAVSPRMLAAWLGLAAAHLLAPAVGRGQDAGSGIDGVEATAVRPVVPLLIRNEHNPLLRVVVDVGRVKGALWARDDVRLTSMTFSLAGTDDLGDLASLQLLASGNDEEFRQRRYITLEVRRERTITTPVSAAAAPAATVTLSADLPLDAGKNVFWLVCRLKETAGLSHRIAATCTEITTSVGRLVPSDESPGYRQRIGFAVRRANDDGVATYAIPILATTTKGTLLCAYDMRWRAPGHDLQGHITTGLSRSPDGGRSWEPMRTIMDMGEYGGLPREQNGVSDPGMVVDRRTGEIFCFAIWMHGRPGRHQYTGGSDPGFEIGTSAQILLVRSRDDGLTWTKPENLTRRLKRAAWWVLAPCPTQGIQIADGTLILPMEGRDENGQYLSTLITSHDHGASWATAEPIPLRGCNECQAVELGDGSLMLNARIENPRDAAHRAVYVTSDLGRTWRAHPTDRNTLIEPPGGCNASLFRLEDPTGPGRRHVLLFFNPHSETTRHQQTLQISFDDGLTWPRDHHLVLDEGGAWAYPCFSQIDANHVGLAYASSQADVTFQVLSVAELVEGSARR